jgi:hypothetical protein
MVKMGSLFGDLPTRPLAEEVIDVLLKRAPVRIERIVSTGQITKRSGTIRMRTSGYC